MEPPRKSHATELSLCGAMPDDAKESVDIYTELDRLHAPVTALIFDRSGTQIHDPEVAGEGWGQLSWPSLIN